MSEVSLKSTKQQIWDTYQKTLKELESTKAQKQTSKEKSEQLRKETVKESVQDLLLKDILNEDIIKQYSDLVETIDYMKEEIKSLYGIEAEVNTLEALVNTHNELKEKLEKEYLERKAVLESEYEQRVSELENEFLKKKTKNEEEIEELKKERAREEEQYLYDLKKSRRDDNDKWEEEKAKRTLELKAKEDEFEAKKMEADDKILSYYKIQDELQELKDNQEEIVKQAVNKAIENSNKEHLVEKTMLEKEKKWLEEKYTNDNNALVERLNAEKENNKILAGKLDAAYAQIRDIATQTVQANGAIRIMETNSSKN